MELVYMAKNFVVTAAKVLGGMAWRLICGIAVWIAGACTDLVSRVSHKMD